jgi:hypothetical protein
VEVVVALVAAVVVAAAVVAAVDAGVDAQWGSGAVILLAQSRLIEVRCRGCVEQACKARPRSAPA